MRAFYSGDTRGAWKGRRDQSARKMPDGLAKLEEPETGGIGSKECTGDRPPKRGLQERKGCFWLR